MRAGLIALTLLSSAVVAGVSWSDPPTAASEPLAACTTVQNEWRAAGGSMTRGEIQSFIERTPPVCTVTRAAAQARIDALTPAPSSQASSRAPPQPAPDSCAAANAAWRYLRESTDRAALQNFIDDTDAHCTARARAEERLAALPPPASQSPPVADSTGEPTGSRAQANNRGAEQPREGSGPDLGRIAGVLIDQYARQRAQRGDRNSGGATSAPRGPAPDFRLNPNYATIALITGFTPDPHVIDLRSGGEVDAAALNAQNPVGNCIGMVAAAPDVRLNYRAGDRYPLIISVASASDTTLVVNGPDGRWYCNDDGPNGRNPSLRFDNPASGQYDIWVGTYGSRELRPAQLNISEVTSR